MPNEEMSAEEKEMIALLEAETTEKTIPDEPAKPPEEKKKPAPPKKPPAKKKDDFSMWNWLVKMVGYNVGEIFGDTGSGKTKFSQQVAYECTNEGKKVLYIDTEANFSDKDIETLKKAGVSYKLMANKDDLYNMDRKAIHGYDLVIVDSATLAITGLWFKLHKMDQRGKLLQQLQGFVYTLSQYCIEKRNCIVLLTAQPISVLGDRNVVQPVGDKTAYMCKALYYIRAPREGDTITSRNLVTFRDRSFPDGTLITEIKTKKFGADLDHKRMQEMIKDL